MQYLFPFLVASVASLIACLVVLRVFPEFKLMDKPKKYGLKRAPIPYSVGIVLYLIFLSTVLFFLPVSQYPSVVGVLIGAGLIVGVSFFDDYRPLPASLRLIVQGLAGVIIVYSGVGIHSISNPFGEPFSLDSYITMVNGFEIIWLADIFTILWIIILINSVNWLDGVNGLASGVGGIAALALFFLSSRSGFHMIDQEPVIIMSVILAGIFLVFWCFDFYPAKMLMGDSGSMFLGFMLAVLSIFSGGKIATAFLILGFPLLDFFWVILQRVIRGQSPFKGKDRLHLHDKLMDMGIPLRWILFLIYVLCAVFGFSALFLGSMGKFAAVTIMAVIMIVMVLVTWQGERSELK
ncbi:undecaprenyl/decaprenyl-phosphate alpha-N-acetylglucosaminyl 1-phosphate transferase [Candidatus Peregrinibacteria bacterium]|jgi:UDP-GlcNAc:undecaprenyl-phosphate/decaprenyl-phosphate GlcNAc-1-phosphate transferase|nr:undecaprenyl/decaprenyl-phosphate alpha-N-acetylglucosaminyl 1-phosphate transferase [Candidatus Peregrinibacteria bacterium]